MKNGVPNLPQEGLKPAIDTTHSAKSQKEFQTIVDELLSGEDQPEFPEELEFMKEAFLSDEVKKAVRNLLKDIAGRFIMRVRAKMRAERSNKNPAKIVNIDGGTYIQIPFQDGMQDIAYSHYDDSELSDAFRSLYYKQLRDFSIKVYQSFLDKDQETMTYNIDGSWSNSGKRKSELDPLKKILNKNSIPPEYLELRIFGKKRVSLSEITHVENKLKSKT